MVGLEDKAQIVLDNIQRIDEKGYVPPSQLAIEYCGLKQYDHAFDLIEEVFLVHDPWIIWTKHINLADPIRDNHRIKSLMGRMEIN